MFHLYSWIAAETPSNNNTNRVGNVLYETNFATSITDEKISEPLQSPQPETSKQSEAKIILDSLSSPPKARQTRKRKRKAEKANVITASLHKAQLLEKKSSKSSYCSKKKKQKKNKDSIQEESQAYISIVV